jgi:rifampicin phosphotransferase
MEDINQQEQRGKLDCSDLRVPPGDDSWDREHDQPPQPYDLWTRTNLGENLPYPLTPLTATNFPALFALNNAASTGPQLTRRLYGRLYFNEGAFFQNFVEEMGLPASWLHKMWGSRQRRSYVYKNTFRPLRLLHWLSSQLLARVKAKKRVKTPRSTPRQFFAQIDQWVNEFTSIDLATLDDRQLWREGLPRWSERGGYAFATNMRFSLGAAFSYGLLERVARWWTGEDVAQELVMGLTGVYSAEVGPVLWRMARSAQECGLEEVFLTHDPMTMLKRLYESEQGHPFIELLVQFLIRHGHRCPNELELLHPRWAEAPEQVIALVDNYLRAGESINPLAAEAEQRKRRKDTVTSIEAQLDPLRRLVFRLLLKRAQCGVVVRDNSRYYMAKFIFPTRRVYAELGERWVERGLLKQTNDIFFLTLAEITTIIEERPHLPSKMQELVEQRRLAYDFWYTVAAPDSLGPDALPMREEEQQRNVLKGIAASSGCVRGRARVVQTIQEALETRPLQQGDILVTTATDPGWTPIFPLVSGLVLEIGGQLSHGAIVAREYGIPVVVNVRGATRLIADGQMIEIDGSKGLVTLK